MKKKILWMLPVLILAALLLLVYETRSSFTLKTEGNGIAVTANNVIENSARITSLKVEENEAVFVESKLGEDDQLRMLLISGILGRDKYADCPSVDQRFQGNQSQVFHVRPGTYSVMLITVNEVNGTMVIRTEKDQTE